MMTMRWLGPCALVGTLLLVACAQGVDSSGASNDDDGGVGGNVGGGGPSSASGGSGGATGGQGGMAATGSGGTGGGVTVGPVGSGGSGGTGPRAPLAGELVISEFMPNPNAVGDDVGEWVELANISQDTLLLDGCRLYDLNTSPDEAYFNAGTLVSPGARVLAAKTANSAQNGGINGVVLAFGTAFTLANASDEVIVECGGVLIDQIIYDSSWAFSVGASAQLPLSQLSAQANDLASNWCTATSSYGLGDLGSPGLSDAACP